VFSVATPLLLVPLASIKPRMTTRPLASSVKGLGPSILRMPPTSTYRSSTSTTPPATITGPSGVTLARSSLLPT
jgi:hypothetical protein